MKITLRLIIKLGAYLWGFDKKATRRYMATILSGTLTLYLSLFAIQNLPLFLEQILFPKQEEEYLYLEAQEDMYFQNEIYPLLPSMYEKYNNNGYVFEVNLFDYTMEMPFANFFNYHKIINTDLLDNQIILGGGIQLYYDLSQILQKSFLHPQELHQYLQTLPIPLSVRINNYPLTLLISGFSFLEEEQAVVIKNSYQWSGRILRQAGCKIVDDERIATEPNIEKNIYMLKIEVSNLPTHLLLFCDSHECLVQKASHPLFDALTIDQILDPYIYTPLSPYVSGVIYENNAFQLQNIQINNRQLLVNFQIDETLSGKQEVAISKKLQNELGIRIGESILLSGREDNIYYKVSKIIDKEEMILYQSSTWTYYGCKSLSGAINNEFLAKQIYIKSTESFTLIQEKYSQFTIQSSRQWMKESLASTWKGFHYGLLFWAIGGISIAIISLWILTRVDQHTHQKSLQLLSSYGYSQKILLMLVLYTNMLKTAIATLIASLWMAITVSILNFLIQDVVATDFLFKPFEGGIILAINIVLNVIVLGMTFVSFMSIKDSSTDF